MIIAHKTCVVTGAARGLGRAIASHLAEKGAKVYATDISAAGLEALKLEAESKKWSLNCAELNVCDEDAVQAFMEKIASEGSRLDILVNNAGITKDGLFVKIKDGHVKKMPLTDFQNVINVNLSGVFLCAREAVPLMSEKGGVIINISSISRAGNIGQTNYSASKAGVDAMTVVWAKELARYNIRVAAIAPGYINTEMVAAIKPEALEKITSQVPLKRLGEMNEIVRTVEFIVENDFVNGRVLEIDGGLRI